MIGGDFQAPNWLDLQRLHHNLVTDMKVLTVGAQHDKLNRFQMFLALSERLIPKASLVDSRG